MALSVTVTPGMVVGATTPVNADTLNAIANPIVSVSGSLDGSESVSVDGVTIDHGGAGSSIQVMAGAIGKDQAATSLVDGTTLTGGAGTALSLKDGGVSAAKLAAGAVTAAAVDWAGAAITPGANVTVDWSTGLTHELTTNVASTAVTFSNSVDGQSIILAVTYGGEHGLTWAAGAGMTLKWKGGTAPTASGSGKTDLYGFVRVGSVIYGSAVSNFS